MNLDAAYAHCEAITRAQARNFSYGIRLLPAPRRRALSAIYAMARRIDDIGDGDLPPADALEALAGARKALGALTSSEGLAAGEDPVLVALADVAGRFPVPLEAFSELVEGCEMDVQGTEYETFDDLVAYCRRVAGSIGRLTLGVLDAEDQAAASSMADSLGVALQLTNILRDLAEDRDQRGRVYVPADARERFGVGGDLSGPPGAIDALVVYVAMCASPYWSEGERLLELLGYRARACVATMAGIYRRLLARILSDPAEVMHRRVSLPAWEKAWIVSQALAGRRPW